MVLTQDQIEQMDRITGANSQSITEIKKLTPQEKLTENDFAAMDKIVGLKPIGNIPTQSDEGDYLKNEIQKEDPEHVVQWQEKGAISPYEAALNAAREFNGTYENIDNSANLTFTERQLAKGNEYAGWQKKGQEFFKKIDNKLNKFFDGNAVIAEQKKQAELNEQRQGVHRNDLTKRYEVAAFSKTGQPIYKEVDLLKQIGFLEGMQKRLHYNAPIIGAIAEGADIKKQRDIQERIIKGEPIRQDELDYINHTIARKKEEIIRGYSIGGQIGSGLVDSLGLTTDILIGSYLGGALGLGTRASAIASKVPKAAGVVEWGVNTLAGAGLTVFANPQRLNAQYQERMLGNEMKLTDTGNVIFSESDEKPATAFFKSMLGLYIMYFTEMGGGAALSAVTKGAAKSLSGVAGTVTNKLIAKNPQLGKLLTSTTKEFSKQFERLRGLPVLGKSTGWLKNKAHFDGFLEEMGEEALEDVLRLTFGVDNKQRSLENYAKAAFKTPEEWAIIAGTILIQGAGLSATSYVLGNKMAEQGASRENIEEVLNNTTESQKNDIVQTLLENKNINIEETAKLKGYIAYDEKLKADSLKAGRSEEQAQADAEALARIDTILLDKYNDNGDASKLIQNRNLKIINNSNQEQIQNERNFAMQNLSDKVVQEFAPQELQTDAKTFQYKDNSDSEGVTDRLRSVEEFDPTFAGLIVVYETKDGRKIVADGHQRFALAKRLNDPNIKLNGILYKEEDGYTPEQVRMIAAQKNIAEGSGTPLDTAKIIREMGVDNIPKSIPRKGTLYEYGIPLARLGDDAFYKVVNGAISPAQGAVIGDIIKDDHTKQTLAIDAVKNSNIDNLSETAIMAREVLYADTRTYEQTNLFGTSLITESAALEKVKIVNETLKLLRKSKNLMGHLQSNSNAIEKAGNVLNKQSNEEIKNAAENAIYVIEKLASMSGEIYNKANALALAVKNEEITHNAAVLNFRDFCLRENILKIAFGQEGTTVVKAVESPQDDTAQGQESLNLFKPQSEVAAKEEFNPKEKPEELNKYEDFGEKIEGAKKDLWHSYEKSLSDPISDDAEKISLSEAFPEPNYEALIREGANVDVLACIKAFRDKISSKPRYKGTYGKRKRALWLESVKSVREMAYKLISKNVDIKKFFDTLDENQYKDLKEIAEVYMAVGYPAFKNAKGYSIGFGSYKIADGIKYDTPQLRYSIDRDYRIIKTFDTKEEAIDYLRGMLLLTPESEKRKTKLDIYQVRKTREIIIGKKVGTNKYIDLKGGFESSKAARSYIKEHEGELLELLQKKKETPETRGSANKDRIGDDYRVGMNISPEKFAAEFGFRGVQFGNYVEQKKRIEDINETYDALLDMSNLLDIPSRAISLNGTLGLAFGARGEGGKKPAMAHYEPDQVVINLTKKRGAGCLAHEWWHSFDNFFGRKVSSSFSYITEIRNQSGMREDLFDAYKNIVQVLNKSEMFERSKKLDETRTKDYWTTTREMTARGFEAYIIAKAKIKGFRNDYLANILSENEYSTVESYPYPLDNELEDVIKAYDNLFSILKTEETEKGITFYQSVKNNDVKSFYQSGKKQEVKLLDWTNKFDKVPTFKEIEKHLQNIIKSGVAFNTLSPEWKIDIKSTGNAEKIVNQGNFQKLNISASKRHNKYVQGIEELINNSVYHHSSNANKPKPHIRQYHYFTVNILIGDNVYIVSLECEELNKDKKKTKGKPQTVHLYNIKEIKRLPKVNYGLNRNSSAGYYPAPSKKSDSNLNQTNGDVNSFSQSLKSDSFKRWFGDSKVVDENGKPLVVYHGTTNEFSEFKRGDIGFHFGTKEAAQSRINDTDTAYTDIMPAYLSIKNPLILKKDPYQFDETGELPTMLKELGLHPEDVLTQEERIDTEEIEDNGDNPYIDMINFRNALIKKGYDGLIYPNEFEDKGSVSYVAFNSEQIKSVDNVGTFDVENPNIYMQDEERAKITFNPNETIIELFKGNDASSVVHELAHLYLHDLQELAKTNNRAEKDLSDLYGWLGVDKNADHSSEEIREYHEKFARSFEAYLMNGVAPTKKIQSLFDKFKEFLHEVYSNMKELNVVFSDEVKKGFDRLFTTDEEYEKEVLPMYEQNQELADSINADISLFEKVQDKMSAVWKDWQSFYDSILIPIDTRLERVNPELKNILRKHTFNLIMEQKSDSEEITPFLNKVVELKKNETIINFSGKDFNAYKLLSYALNNRDDYTVRKIVKELGIQEEYSKVRKLLDELHGEIQSVGIEIGYLESYFPRMIKYDKTNDFIAMFEKMAQDEEFDLKQERKALKDAEYSDVKRQINEADPNKLWGKEDKARLINTSIRGFGKNNILLSRIAQLKFERSIDKLTPEQQQFYEPIEVALASYVLGSRKNIEERKFFGAENKEVSKLRATIKRKRLTIKEVTERTPYIAKQKELQRLRYEYAGLSIKPPTVRSEIKEAEERLKKEENRDIKQKIKDSIKIKKEYLEGVESKVKRLEEQLDWVEKASPFQVKGTIIKRLYADIKEAQESINAILGDDTHVEDSIGALVTTMAEKKLITSENEFLVRQLLTARFNSIRYEKVATCFRDTSTIITLNDITNAITQFGDLTFGAFKFGLFNTFAGMRKAIGIKEKIKREDLGLNNIAEEFKGGSGAISKWLNIQLKLIGLDAIDGFAKNAEINASLIKAKNDALKNSEEFNEKLKYLFDKNAETVKQDLISGNINNDVLFIAFNDLADIQPITADQMTRGYQSAFRPLYVLKTYSIKALDIARNDCFSHIGKGIHDKDKDLLIKGLVNLIRLQLFMWLFGIPKDIIKDFIANKEMNIPEYFVDNIIIFGLFNRFLANKVIENPANIYLENVKMPAVQAIGDLATAVKQVSSGKKDIKDVYVWSRVPLFGKTYYNWFGGAKNKRNEF